MPDLHRMTIEQVEKLELAPGSQVEQLQGWVPAMASEQEVREALEKAFDYRGDVTLTLKDGRSVEAYIFDRRTGKTLQDSFVQYFTADAPEKARVSYAEIAGLAFSGKDCAAGKHWQDWVKKYNERKAAGETNIGLHPEKLD